MIVPVHPDLVITNRIAYIAHYYIGGVIRRRVFDNKPAIAANQLFILNNRERSVASDVWNRIKESIDL